MISFHKDEFEALHTKIYSTIAEEDIDILSGDGIKIEFMEKESNIKLPKDLKYYYYYFNRQREYCKKGLLHDPSLIKSWINPYLLE